MRMASDLAVVRQLNTASDSTRDERIGTYAQQSQASRTGQVLAVVQGCVGKQEAAEDEEHDPDHQM